MPDEVPVQAPRRIRVPVTHDPLPPVPGDPAGQKKSSGDGPSLHESPEERMPGHHSDESETHGDKDEYGERGPGDEVSERTGSRDEHGMQEPEREGTEKTGSESGPGSRGRTTVTDPGEGDTGRSGSGDGYGMKGSDRGPGDKTPPEGSTTDHPDGTDPFPPGWHRADRDWKICGTIPLILFFTIGILMVRLDLHTHGTMMIFFLPFLGFMGLVSGFFFFRAFRMRGYGARFVFHRFGVETFIPGLRERIMETSKEEPENIDPVSGHTFGLLFPRVTWKLTSGEVIEVSDLKGPMTSVLYGRRAGNSLGLYFLVQAPGGSGIWAMLDAFIAAKDDPTPHRSTGHAVR